MSKFEYYSVEYDDELPRADVFAGIFLAILAFALVWLVAAGFVRGTTQPEKVKAQQVSSVSVAKALFGFESGKEYPLDMGQQVANLNLSVQGFFFYLNASASTSQAVHVTFMHDNEAYLVQLPLQGVNRAQIFIDDSKPATMKVVMQDDKNIGVYLPNPPNCHTEFNRSRFLVPFWYQFCDGPGTLSTNLFVSSDIEDAGLQGLLENRPNGLGLLKSATLTMPRDMYNQLVGQIKPGAPESP